MALLDQLPLRVSREVRRRGEMCFRRGGVSVFHGNARVVHATVDEDHALHRVMVLREEDHLRVLCTCKVFVVSKQTCAHICAAIVAADANGFLGAGDSASRLRMPKLAPEIEAQAAPPEARAVEGSRSGHAASSSAGLRSVDVDATLDRPSWRQQLERLRRQLGPSRSDPKEWPERREIVYIVDMPNTRHTGLLTVELAVRDRLRNDAWSRNKMLHIAPDQIDTIPSGEDREILALLIGAERPGDRASSAPRQTWESAIYQPTEPQQQELLPRMARSGRLWLRSSQRGPEEGPFEWDGGAPWQLWLELRRRPQGHYRMSGSYRRGKTRVPIGAAQLALESGFLLVRGRLARLRHDGAFAWVELLLKEESITVPSNHDGELLEELYRVPALPRLDLPKKLRLPEVKPTPRPQLRLEPTPRSKASLVGTLRFNYLGREVVPDDARRRLFESDGRQLIVRDAVAERAATERLAELGCTPRRGRPVGEVRVPASVVWDLCRSLIDEGWSVQAEGNPVRSPGEAQIHVRSGIDWLELHGSVDFGDQRVELPTLLSAVRRGEGGVVLGDGSRGLVPQAWLSETGFLLGMGTLHKDHLRFKTSQAGLLDVLLAAQREASCDELFEGLRRELGSFDGIRPVDPQPGFTGELRPYQREGLGWLLALRLLGLGGCLADDMGLGKTVQVLALLVSRRPPSLESTGTERLPSLVVVPRSLVFHWVGEAQRFAPELRVLVHTGAERGRPGASFRGYDLVVTTYGTLRRDAVHFKDVKFDTCILDESQSIKNANTQAAKAVRLIDASQRLALSGTPVENHLGELWSLFEFLNPGMLGTAGVFRRGLRSSVEPEVIRGQLARALRPFILRRTKEAVAKELPPKLEQTIYCELEPEQRKLYDELRIHYRDSLLGRIETDGIARSKIHILEALLRLRQAACHPSLIDRARLKEPSAKLEVLLPQLTQVLEERHKALVFSQFTRMLDVVRDRLDREGIAYEYLDGRTRNRRERVERFQTDGDCRLFLISLKAGGLGLNLTAAEYVYLLDPWWNPAVEAQAVDRAHRIGQTRRVFAYRLITRDSIEEKVLELQERKRHLAEAIVRADASLMESLAREDLELLLS